MRRHCSRIVVLDLNADLAGGQALDLLYRAEHSRIKSSPQAVTNIFPVAMSSASRPVYAASRMISRPDLINRNTDLFVSILTEVAKAGVKKTPSCWSSRTPSTS